MDYIKRLLSDKTRLKQWRKRMLGLSCVIVFCTVYALILPAITMEKKAVCGREEHSHTKECYSFDGQLSCGKEEHMHTFVCYLGDDVADDTLTGSEDTAIPDSVTVGTEGTTTPDKTVKTEDTTIPDETVKTEGTTAPDDAVKAEGTTTPDETVKTEGTTAPDDTTSDELPAEDKAETSEDEKIGGETTAAATADAYNLTEKSDNIDGVSLSYENEDGTWSKIEESGSGKIPADAKIKLSVGYKDIPVRELMTTYNCTITCDLPELLRDVTSAGEIMEGTVHAGTITVRDGKIVATFNREYLQNLEKNGSSSIKGDFEVTGKVNLNKVGTDGKTMITVAGKKYELDFGSDVIAQYGEVNVQKECTSPKLILDESGDYLSYTIKVTAGEYGCPDVSVVDSFTSNQGNVSYVGITTTETTLKTTANDKNPYETANAGSTPGSIYLGNGGGEGSPVPEPGAAVTQAPGSLVWKIGGMQANETRTLTYYVKLKDDVIPNQMGDITNKAVVYSKEYKRKWNDAAFTPKISYQMPKEQQGITRNDDGTYTIKYKLNFRLDESQSNYPLKNFEFLDYLDHERNATRDEALPYISYDQNSVELYVQKKGTTSYSKANERDYTTSWSNDQSNYKSPWTESDGNPTCFKISGADGKPIVINPGDSYYVTYSVTVSPEVFAATKANSVEVKNRWIASASNADKSFGTGFNAYNNNNTVGAYQWDKKTVGATTTAEQKITMSGSGRYDLTGGSIKPDNTTENTFTVPAGSYPYTVNVNQTLGEWDASEVSMKDILNSDKMQYTGYLKVEAKTYNKTTGGYDTLDTKWVKIDGKNSFALKPSELGWNGQNYAYTFTYYAKPAKQETFSAATVTNEFKLEGNVKRGGNTFPILGISSKTDVTISGNFSLDVQKTAWYFEEPEKGAETWTNGKIYWALEITGTAILQNTAFRDSIISENGTKNSYLHADSLAGIYKGKLKSGSTIAEYGSLEDLKKDTGLSDITDQFTNEFTNNRGFTGTDRYSELTLKANEQISLNGDKIYIIIASEPEALPVKDRDAYTYKNKVSTSDDGTNWIDQSTASKSLYGGADILKELGQTFTYDGTNIKSNNDGFDKGDSSKIVKDQLTGSGLYAAWAFKLNYAGELSGKFRVLEDIPDGMELAYIRIKWTGSGQKTIRSYEMPKIASAGWEKKSVTATTDNNRNETTTYYVKGNQALIQLGDFIAGKIRDEYSVDVQVVCKVTDTDVLLGGQTKEFVNRVTLQTEAGKTIETATAPAELKIQNLKKGYASSTTESGRVNFTIEANQLGQAIPAEDGATLKLIDKLSPELILDTTTIKVVNLKDNRDVRFTASLEADNTLEIIIPHDTPVRITYTAIVNAPPATNVNFSNVANWENYTPSEGSKVEVSDYSYTAGGTVTAGTNIKLDIIKKDKNNLSLLLPNAEFEMVECELGTDNVIKEKDKTGKWSGKTETSGKLSFGDGSSGDQVMNYNTIYKITEKKAPEGYIKDDTSYYIMVPRKEEGATNYSEYVKKCMENPKIKIQYQSPYELTVTNHRGEITVEKKFLDAGGHEMSPVSGTYWFGIYDKPDGTNPSGVAQPLQKISITYNAGDTVSKTEKFINLDLSTTYYIFELDDAGNPIKNDSGVVTVNNMEYLTSYQTTKDGSVQNGASSNETVTVFNKSRVKELPSTGSHGVLIYRFAGLCLTVIAGLLLMKNRKRKFKKL